MPTTYSTLNDKDRPTVDSPLKLCFPTERDEETLVQLQGAGDPVKQIIASNGMSVSMWDISETHLRPGYDAELNQRKSLWSFSSSPRSIFDGENLIGYHDNGRWYEASLDNT